jgi:hypothetical protein
VWVPIHADDEDPAYWAADYLYNELVAAANPSNLPDAFYSHLQKSVRRTGEVRGLDGLSMYLHRLRLRAAALGSNFGFEELPP